MTHKRWGAAILLLYFAAAGAAVWRLRAPASPPAPRASAPAAVVRPHSHEGMIAVVEFQGPISLSMGGLGQSDVERSLRHLRELRDRKDIKAVILRINSPGGSVAAVQEVHQEVLALRKAGKVVVSSFGDVAASGGYYIAAASDRIVANPGSLTGSIGVLFQLGNVQELFKKFGVRMETIKSGALKDAGSPFRDITAQERLVFQGLVGDAYDQFFQAVSEGRNMPARRLRPLADGRVFTGAQAKAVGLVDELGGFETAVQVAKELAGLKAEKPVLFYPVSPWERFTGLLGGAASQNRLPWGLNNGRGARFEYVWE